MQDPPDSLGWVTTPDAEAVARALRSGPATLDALAARLGGVADRDALDLAISEAADRGWVRDTSAPDCGPDGVCGDAPPTVLALTEAGRAARR